MCEIAVMIAEELERLLSKSPPLSLWEEAGVHTAMCRGKIRFPSRNEARKISDHLRRNSTANKLNSYHCLFCEGWHNGNHTYDKHYYKSLQKRVKATLAIA